MRSSNEEFLQQIGQQIRAARLNAGFTQQYLAYRLGITQQFISRIETGKHAIRVDMLKELAEICQVPLISLIDKPDSASQAVRFI